MWWRAFDTTAGSKASSVRRPQKKTDWSPHYKGAEHKASTGGLLVPRLREAWVPTPPTLSPARQSRVRGSTAPGRMLGAETNDEFWPQFWQKIEDSELKRTKDSWRREKILRKNMVMQVDPLEDSSLYDLKLHHNSAQRAKTISLPTSPSSVPSLPTPPSSTPSRESANNNIPRGAPQQMRELRVAFERRQRGTANIFGMSGKEHAPGGRGRSMKAVAMTVGATSLTLRSKHERSGSFIFKGHLKELFQKVRDQSSTPVNPFEEAG